MFWLFLSGVLFLCVSNGLEYYDEDYNPGLKKDSDTPVDMDYISGIFGDGKDHDGNII